jgi:predicted Rossmann fold nucleotide-binding protein DprA/Smf involved in DNA uptake
MQEPLDNLSEEARNAHAFLDADPNTSYKLEEIAKKVGLTEGQTANALRELNVAQRAAETFGGWSVVQ